MERTQTAPWLLLTMLFWTTPATAQSTLPGYGPFTPGRSAPYAPPQGAWNGYASGQRFVSPVAATANDAPSGWTASSPGRAQPMGPSYPASEPYYAPAVANRAWFDAPAPSPSVGGASGSSPPAGSASVTPKEPKAAPPANEKSSESKEINYNDKNGFVKSPIEPPVPFGWYPPAAGMQGFPPVPKFVDEGKTLHEAIEQNLTVRLRGGGILRPYGFARADLDVATHLFNDIQNPFFVQPGTTGVKLPGAAVPVDVGQTNYSLYPRLTRLGVEYYGLPIELLDDAVAHARVEIDFLTSPTSDLPSPATTVANLESRQLLRLRLAYGQLTYHDWTFVAGQDWDLASPLFPSINDNTLQWNAGNTGDRRPQMKILWDHDFGDGYRLQFQNGLALLDAINAVDRDGDGIRDNEFTGIPGYEGRVGFVAPSWVEGKRMLGGFWGVWGTQRMSVPVAGRRSHDIWAYGTDLHIPLTDMFTFRGEFFHGENLDDFRGGIAQGINPLTGSPISTTGGWFELVTQPWKWYQNSVGYSVDDPENSDVQAGGRTLNHSFYVGNRFIVGRGVVFGLDFQHWLTHYQGLATGNSSLFKFFAQVNF